MKTISVRLENNQKLKSEIKKVAEKHKVKAGFVLTCVGNLKELKVRMAGATSKNQDIRSFRGDFEIVSLVGTISKSGCHLHISFSDQEGKVSGGHLKEAKVSLTAELVLGIEDQVNYSRVFDKNTGFKELFIS